MLTIRLQRTGKRNHAMYRVVLAEKTAHVSKKFNEILGNYNPHTKQLVIKNPERLTHWISQHVSISPTLHNLLVTNNLLNESKVKAFNTPKPEVKAEAPAAQQPAAEAPAEGSEPAPEAKSVEEAAPETPAEAPAETPAAE